MDKKSKADGLRAFFGACCIVIESLQGNLDEDQNPLSSGNIPTTFSRLPKEAQDLIVRSTLGEFDSTQPPQISERGRDEIVQWTRGCEV